MSTPSRSSCRIPIAWPELAACASLDGCADDGLAQALVTSIADDSRRVTPGACFVAVRGTKSDGHRYVRQAVDAGAVVIVVEDDAEVGSGAPAVRVADSRAALAKLASAFYGLRGAGALAPTFIGITGTNGKTTIAWILRSILNTAGHRTAVLGTIEYDLISSRRAAPHTTPPALELALCLAEARDAGANFAILEVSSHALDQRRTDGLEFSAGVFTNLTGDHLDYHGDMDTYRQAKRRLFENLSARSIAVLNADDPSSKVMAAGTKATPILYGLDSPDAVVTADLRTTTSSGSTFVLRSQGFETMIRSRLVGRHNVLNVLAAAATAEHFGVAPAAIREGVERSAGAPGRLQPVHSSGAPFGVFVDYAHTDDALRNALEAVRPLTANRLICVFGCGGDRDRGKRPRMAAVVEELADIAFVTSDNPRHEAPMAIIDEILVGFSRKPRCRVEVEADRRAAIGAAIAEALPGDTVLIAGKGHETYQQIGDDKLDFDDSIVARQFLARSTAMEGVA